MMTHRSYTRHKYRYETTGTDANVTSEGASLTRLKPASSRPIMPVHDVYMGGAKPTMNDDLRTYLLKISVQSDSIMFIVCISADNLCTC